MAKKPSESDAPETAPAKKTVTRKPASRKAAEPKKTADKTAPKTTKKKVVAKEAPAVKEPKKEVKEVSVSTPSEKKAPAKSRSNVKNKKPQAQVKEVPAESSVKVADKAPAEKVNTSPAPKVEQKKNNGAPKVFRESFKRPHKQEHREQRDDRKEKSEISEFSPSDAAFAQPETVGGGNDFAANKRKRRRRNKKGNQQTTEERIPNFAHENAHRDLDAKKLSARAWKIFLAEVTEEGLALVDDHTAREAARRSFRCAELFMIEEDRRKHHHRHVKPTPPVETITPIQEAEIDQESDLSED